MSDSEPSPQEKGAEFVALSADEMQHALREHEGQAERPVPPYGVQVEHMRLYYGANMPGLQELRPTSADNFENITIGSGLYLTSNSKAASSYAEIRADENGGEPVLYEVDINDMTFCDLTAPEGFSNFLEDWFKQHRQDMPAHTLHAVAHVIRTINRNTALRVDRLYTVLESVGPYFSEYLAGLGFDGLIGVERGERRAEVNEVTGTHDSYVVFDPSRVQIEGEHTLRPGS
jgi:hypothetical protein